MRQIFFLLQFFLMPAILISQNVGIGTTLPATKLHVHGGGDQYLRVHSNNNLQTSSAYVGLRLTTSSLQIASPDWQVLNDGDLTFNWATDDFITDNGVEFMRLTSSGQLGIGSTSPTEKLHVRGNGDQFVRVQAYNLGGLSAKDAGIRFTTDGIGSTDWQVLNNGSLTFNSATDDFSSGNGAVRMALTAGGYLGLGTASPRSTLHVQTGEEVNYTDDGHLMIGAESGLNMIMDNNEILARNSSGGSPLYIQNDGGDVLLCTKELGGVGIGVGAGNIPSGYLLAVDGKIISEELRVDLSGSWPDYVFTEDYVLTPLDVLETQIATLGHLPGIPAASEVEESGQHVGDIQRRLLEKVEELTLYTISLKKEIEALRDELDGLRR